MSNEKCVKEDLLPSYQTFPFNDPDFSSDDANNNRELLENFFDSMPTAIVLINADGRLSYLNKRAKKLYGINYQGFDLQSYAAIVMALKPDGTAYTAEDLTRLLKSGENLRNKEVSIRKADGSRIHILVSTAPVFDGQGRVIANIATFDDISELKKVEETIQIQNFILQGISRIFHKAITSKSQEDLGKICLRVALELTESKIGFIGETDSEGRSDNSSKRTGWFACQLPDRNTYDFRPNDLQTHGKYGGVLYGGKAFYINDPAAYSDIKNLPKGHPVFNNFLSLPLVEGDKTIGMIGLGNKDGGYNDEDIELLESLTPAIVQALLYKQTTTALQASEEKYRNMMNITSEGILFSDAKFKIAFINKTLAKWLGYKAQELLGRSVKDFVAVEDIDEGRIHFAKIKDGKNERFDFRLKKKDGSDLWLLVSNAPIFDEQGNLNGCLTMFTDITARKEFENQLAFQANLLASVHDVIFATDENFAITYWNVMAEKTFGWSASEAIGKTQYELFKYTYYGYSRKDLLQAILKTGYINHEAILHHKDGREIYTSTHSRIIKDKDGKFKGIVASLRDISERIETEELLRKSEARHAFMLHLSDVLRPIADPNLIKKEATRLLGEYLGADRVIYLKINEDNTCEVKGDFYTNGLETYLGIYDMELFRASFDYVLDGRTLVTDDLYQLPFLDDEELMEYDKLGVRAFVEVPLIKDGKFISLLSVQSIKPRFWTPEEITLIEETAERTWAAVERAYAEEALRESEANALTLVEKLRQADQNKDQFISMLSHELRNPMASIIMSLSLLDRVLPGEGKANKIMDVMKHQVTQLSSLIDDLLEVTRISKNKIKLKKDYIELNHLLRRAVEGFEAMFVDKEVALEVNYAPAPLFLEADQARIITMIGNLLGNAIKFTDEGGKIIVSLTKDKENGDAVITVKDNGMGIDPQMLPLLFEPFVQADNSLDRSRGGLGLGLAVVKGMAEIHDGSVDVYSEGLGKGSEFTIRLPLPDKSARGKKEVNETQGESSLGMRILMIEDNANLNKIMCELLKISGYTTISALNGAEGIAKAQEFHPEVVLCDIGLPDISGYEVAQKMRSDEDLEDIFLIALSGYAEPSDLEKSKIAGFDRHLAKPIEIEALELVLAEAY